MAFYSCDFETTTDPEDVRVWAWGAYEIYTGKWFEGSDIDSFMKWMFELEAPFMSFHNEKFDGEFILHWLLTHGFEWTKTHDGNKRKRLEVDQFETLISDMGQFYTITVALPSHNKKGKSVNRARIQDSLKKLPFSVKSIAKAFKMDVRKGEIDYNKLRPVGYKMDEFERSYLFRDCKIAGDALKIQFDQGLDHLTAGSDALHTFLEMYGKKKFRRHFPVLTPEVDKFVRNAYRGGWTYLKPEYAGKVVYEGDVYDVNSLYPWAMRENPMPWGYPVYFSGRYKETEEFPLYIQCISCAFDIKPGRLPTVQIKHSAFYRGNEYLTKSEGDVILYLTSVDLALFFDQYEVYNLQYIDGFMFRSLDGVFSEYIDKYMEQKATSSGALRQLAKLLLNSLYGKFATRIDVQGKVPYLGDDNIVHYKLDDPEEREPIYTPIACFVTAYARNKTIRTAQEVYDRFIYADTDSIHMLDGEVVPFTVHPSDLGAWKHESHFVKAKFLQQKRYVEVMEMTEEDYNKAKDDPDFENNLMTENGKYYEVNIKCAGMPHDAKREVTFENFEIGKTFIRLHPVHKPGGLVLVERTFELK